jgi:hypothetical protein
MSENMRHSLVQTNRSKLLVISLVPHFKTFTSPKQIHNGIHLRQMIFIHGRWFEKLIFLAYGMDFSASLVPYLLIEFLQIKKKL